nr:retrotransposon protein, putative, Ty1-copia subclass [Tanacetum cinerariifolium]
MTRKPFPHHTERATDLLGLIHTDVCGPLRHVSRQGASYFITFTDDYSRYGYVYLLKHKHEVFATFKVFKNEVENQLGKTIKALRSDRGGEYISREFKDYLKACGIVQQLTPQYTPQHNGVLERRNHTLLDMVRSMMNLTTLLLSFWDYALVSATCILNMVSTKKVDKTPYEIWHGKAPNLSYLKVEDDEVGDLKKPANYKTVMLEPDKTYLGECFAMKDLEEATFILGIKIYRDRSKRLIRLNQSAYMDKILKRFRMYTSKRSYILMQERLDMNEIQGASTPEEVKRMQNVPYALAVGEPHKTVVKTILTYLRNTKDMFLVYGGNLEAELQVDCYCDVGFETDRDDTKSQTGYVLVLNGGAVDKKSSKQSTTAMSAI